MHLDQTLTTAGNSLGSPRRAAGGVTRLASLALAATSLVVLDGCQVIKGIFDAGVGVGVVVVLVVLMVGAGIVALVRK